MIAPHKKQLTKNIMGYFCKMSYNFFMGFLRARLFLLGLGIWSLLSARQILAVGILAGAEGIFYHYVSSEDRNRPTTLSLLKPSILVWTQFGENQSSGFSIPLSFVPSGSKKFGSTFLAYDLAITVGGLLTKIGVGPGIELNLTGTTSLTYLWMSHLSFEFERINLRFGLTSFAPFSEADRTVSPFVGLLWRLK